MIAAPRRVVLITGASSGIGAAVARLLAGPEYCLALVARRADRLAELAERIAAHGGEAIILAEDLSDPSAPVRVVQAVLEHFGRLDVLINNAGMGLAEPFTLADPTALDRQIRINFTAPILLVRNALPHLIQSRGSIINVGSSITAVAVPIFGAYGATKAGLAYWNDALRRELIPSGVSVSLVEPGPVATEFFQAVAALGEGRPRPGFCAPAVGREAREAIRSGAIRAEALRFDRHAPAEAPPAFVTASAGRVARRIVRLMERPRRRVSVPRRAVWPFRLLGVCFRAVPALGDMLIGHWLHRRQAPGDRA